MLIATFSMWADSASASASALRHRMLRTESLSIKANPGDGYKVHSSSPRRHGATAELSMLLIKAVRSARISAPTLGRVADLEVAEAC